MRANAYLTTTLLMILAFFLIVLTIVINWLGGAYPSVLDSLTALYYRSQPFILIGTCVGILGAIFGARNTYQDCQHKINVFAWPSEEAKRKAQEELQEGVVKTVVVALLFVGFVLVHYFFFSWNLISSLIAILNIVSIFAVGLFLVAIITLASSLLVELIFGDFL